MDKIKKWPQVDLAIEECDKGLIIKQNNETCLARNWTLSPQIIDVIDSAIQAEFSCLIRYSHPSPNKRWPSGVEYIGFSRVPEERWIFVLDQYSTDSKKFRTHISQITFEKHYQVVLDNAGIQWKPERAGGKNVFIPFSQFHKALTVCNPKIVDSVESVIGSKEWEAKKAEIGLVTEAILESWMIKNWSLLPFGNSIKFLRNQFPADGFIDILAQDKKTNALVVIELKRGIVESEVISEQLTRYVNSSTIQTLSEMKGVRGIVVGRDFAESAFVAAKNAKFDVELFQFHDKLGKISLE